MNRHRWVKAGLVVAALATVATSRASFEHSAEEAIEISRPDVVHFTVTFNKSVIDVADNIQVEVVVEDRFAVNTALDYTLIPDDTELEVRDGNGLSVIFVDECQLPPCSYGFSVDVPGSGDATVTAVGVASSFNEFSDDDVITVSFGG